MSRWTCLRRAVIAAVAASVVVTLSVLEVDVGDHGRQDDRHGFGANGPDGSAAPGGLMVVATPLRGTDLGLTCWQNPPVPNGTLCRPPPSLAINTTISADGTPRFWQFMSEADVESDEAAAAAEARLAPLAGFGTECFLDSAFPPIFTPTTPPFFACIRHITVTRESYTLYWPQDNSVAMVDAGLLMPLMRFVRPDGDAGVAVDVGASTGSVAFPLLAAGHTVHLFDFDLDDPASSNRQLIDMTISVNAGWADRVHFHDAVTISGPKSLDGVLPVHEVPRLDLLKVDVDTLDADTTVFDGASRVLERTDLVQVEMIEIGVEGKRRRRAAMDAAGFDCYAIRGFHRLPGSLHSGDLIENLNLCDDGKPVDEVEGSRDNRSLFEAITGKVTSALGKTTSGAEISALLKEPVHLYQAHGLTDIRLEPVCHRCNPGWILGCREHLLFQTCRQFLFVRRGGPTAARVQAAHGACPS